MNSRRLIASPRGSGQGLVSARVSNVRFFGSKADIRAAKKPCPLYTQKQTFAESKQVFGITSARRNALRTHRATGQRADTARSRRGFQSVKRLIRQRDC